MFGHGRARHRGVWWQPAAGASEENAYIGTCRCGFGPRAFYRDRSGRIVHARQLCRRDFPSTPIREDFGAEVNRLKEEKAEVEKN